MRWGGKEGGEEGGEEEGGEEGGFPQRIRLTSLCRCWMLVLMGSTGLHWLSRGVTGSCSWEFI